MDDHDLRMSNMSMDEKRQSMVGLQKKDRVKKSKKVDVDEIEDLTMAFAAEKKVYDKLALRIEMEVDLEKQEDVLRPWKTAEAEVKLDHTLFEFNQKQVGAFDVIKEIKKPLQEEQMAALSRNISEIVEKSPELPLAGLDAEVMGVIINDIMTVTMTALEKVFGDRRVGEGGVTATLVEGARQALMNSLENAMAECVDLMQQSISSQFLADRSVILRDFQLLEAVREKTKRFSDERSEDTANQCGKNDKLDREWIQFMWKQNEKIEHHLKIIEHQRKKRENLEMADEQFVSSSDEEPEEINSDSESEDEVQDKLKREKARKEKAALKKQAAESLAGSRYANMDEDELEKAAEKSRKRTTIAQARVRELVMESFRSQKGGVAAREVSANKGDLKDLLGLKLGAKNKEHRSPARGRMMMSTLKDLILKKPDAYPAFGPMLACYAGVNVSLSKFLIGTIDRVCGYVEAEEFKNPWGLGYIQIAKFAEEVKTLYDLLNSAVPTSMVASTQPDSDHDVNLRNRKIELRGVKDDAATYIEMWFTQHCYINPRRMEAMRMDVLDIKKLFYKLPLVKACGIAMTIVRNATDQGQKISWFQTGEIWVSTIMVLHSDIKVELTNKKLDECPIGGDDSDCVHLLEKVLEEISAMSLKVQGLKAGVPSKLHANSDLYLTVEDFEVAALMSRATKYTEDLCMTVDGPANQPGGVKPSAHKRNDQNQPDPPADAVYCQAIQGKPGVKCKHYLSTEEKKYHQKRMIRINAMTGGNKPQCHPICARHFFLIKGNKADIHGYGTVLRWQGKGKAPWGKNITKSDLLLDRQYQAAVVAVQPTGGATSPAPAPTTAPVSAWGTSAPVLQLGGGTLSPAQQAGAPEPAPAPAPAVPAAFLDQVPPPGTAATTSSGPDEIMKLLRSMQEDAKNKEAESEYNRRMMQDQLDKMSQRHEQQNQQRGETTGDAERERRIEAIALERQAQRAAMVMEEKKPKASFSFGGK